MKKAFLLGIAFVLAISSTLFAGNEELFSYNKEAIASEFAEITTLENYVLNNPSSTLSALIADQNNLVTGLDLYSSNSMGFSFNEPPLGIPSFLWGCAFGIVGVAIVYFMTEEDRAETKKSFYGCITSSLSSGVIYVVFWSSYYATIGI
jgi:hypothetical protein